MANTTDKLISCPNPNCHDHRPFRVSHETLSVTCGVCLLAGYRAPRLEQAELMEIAA